MRYSHFLGSSTERIPLYFVCTDSKFLLIYFKWNQFTSLYVPNSVVYYQKSQLTDLNRNVTPHKILQQHSKLVPIACGLIICQYLTLPNICNNKLENYMVGSCHCLIWGILLYLYSFLACKILFKNRHQVWILRLQMSTKRCIWYYSTLHTFAAKQVVPKHSLLMIHNLFFLICKSSLLWLFYSGRNKEQIEVRECLLFFGAGSFVFQFATKKFKD